MVRTLLVALMTLTVSATSQGDDAELRALLEKAIQRLGPEKELTRLPAHSVTMKGTLYLEGVPAAFEGELSTQGQDRQRISISIDVGGQSIPFVSAYKSGRGWRSINGTVAEMNEDQLAEARDSIYAGWVASLVPLRDKAFRLTPFGEVDVDGRKAVGINVDRDGHRSVTVFIDKETQRLVRTETTLRDENRREVTEQSTFYDFKVEGGFEQATRMLIKRNGETYAEITLKDFRRTESLDDNQFNQP